MAGGPSYFSWFNQFSTILGGWQADLHPRFCWFHQHFLWTYTPSFSINNYWLATVPLYSYFPSVESHHCSFPCFYCLHPARSCLAAPVPRVASWLSWRSGATRSAARRSAVRPSSQGRSRARRWCRCHHPCDWERWLVWRWCPTSESLGWYFRLF